MFLTLPTHREAAWQQLVESAGGTESQMKLDGFQVVDALLCTANESDLGKPAPPRRGRQRGCQLSIRSSSLLMVLALAESGLHRLFVY